MATLDEALAISAAGPGCWRGRADPAYEASNGMYGGWTAAILLRSVLAEAADQGAPAALTVHYIGRVAPGGQVEIAVRRVGGGRALRFWQAELAVADQPGVQALATVVIADRRGSDGFTDLSMPGAPNPETLPTQNPPTPFGQQADMRHASGHPAFNRADTGSLVWKKEMSGRGLDAAQIAYLSDNFAPRIFFKSPGPRPSATITMSVYFHASPDDLAAVGDDYVLSEDHGTRAESSTIGSQQRLWSRGGVLLSTSEQLCWFR